MKIVKRILTESEVWSEDFLLKIGRGLIFVDALDILVIILNFIFELLNFSGRIWISKPTAPSICSYQWPMWLLLVIVRSTSHKFAVFSNFHGITISRLPLLKIQLIASFYIRDNLKEFRKNISFAFSRFGYSEACEIRW